MLVLDLNVENLNNNIKIRNIFAQFFIQNIKQERDGI